MVLERAYQMDIIANKVLNAWNGHWREIVSAQINHDQVRLICFEVVCNCIMLIENLVVSSNHIDI